MKKIFTLAILGVVFAAAAVQAQDSLFISEVIDPADDYTGRFIELYNAGSSSIDFGVDTFFLSRQSNGGTSWGEVQLSGSIESGSAYVIGGSDFDTIYGFPPDLVTGILTGNGDDAYCLFKDGNHLSGTLLDILGEVDVDGTGLPWEYTDSRAVRSDTILIPSDTWIQDEWIIVPANIADGTPGEHEVRSGNETDPSQDGRWISVQDAVYPLGQTVDIKIEVGGISNEDNIISYQFDIAYDDSFLEYEGFTLDGTIAEGGTAVVNSEIAGQLSVSYMNSEAFTGSGEILLIQFSSTVMDTSIIGIFNGYLNNIPVDSLSSGSVIFIETTSPTARILYDDTENRYVDTLEITAIFSESMSDTDPVLLNMTGAFTLTEAIMERINDTVYTYDFSVPRAAGIVTVNLGGGTDLWGNPLEPVPLEGATFTIIEFMSGDVDDDGLILAYDAALTLQHSVGLDPLPDDDPLPWENWRDSTANVDGAGAITAYDAALILQYSAGIISSFPIDGAKSSHEGDIKVEVEDGYIIFYSSGELIGLNVFASDNNHLLGVPEILDKEIMSAYNADSTGFNLGICKSIKMGEGSALMRIPFMESGNIRFELMVNNQYKTLDLNLVAGISEPGWNKVAVYPNPVTDILRIDGLEESSRVWIYNAMGELIYTIQPNERFSEIDVRELPPGYYIVFVELQRGEVVKKFIKE